MDFMKASQFWQHIDTSAPSMEEDALYEEIYTFLRQHTTCALATASESGIRCTPLTYTVHGSYIDIFSEGGEKFTHLASNPHVALTIFDAYHGPGTAKSVQIMGLAQCFDPHDAEYASILQSIHMEGLLKREGTLYLIRVTPKTIVYVNGELKSRSYGVRQTWMAPN